MRAPRSARLSPAVIALVALAMTAGAALVLYAMGRTPICTCGTVKFWHGVVNSSENSQHLTDWYSFSHIIHGFLFYGGVRVVQRMTGSKLSMGALFLVAVGIEIAWELVENSSLVIERYRTSTMALDYYGDSIINSVSDIVAMMAGFGFAAIAPVWLTIALAVAMELFVGFMIRDNLTLNIVMLVWPMDWIKAWQTGG
ncbi:MAG: hypothetical protein BGP06_18295 [Rhizobiales bacterium 65-9]|nr:DUF2585 domain-containing protein [Hyphomicrobiales bacterium]OJY34782.1 MAG: hypothetical protein BGP06_18295 [Rhizobiales bacterium 65-9]